MIAHFFACLWIFLARIEKFELGIETWIEAKGENLYQHWLNSYICAYYYMTVTMYKKFY